jgi:hypothetical protein
MTLLLISAILCLIAVQGWINLKVSKTVLQCLNSIFRVMSDDQKGELREAQLLAKMSKHIKAHGDLINYYQAANRDHFNELKTRLDTEDERRDSIWFNKGWNQYKLTHKPKVSKKEKKGNPYKLVDEAVVLWGEPLRKSKPKLSGTLTKKELNKLERMNPYKSEAENAAEIIKNRVSGTVKGTLTVKEMKRLWRKAKKYEQNL